MHQNAVKKVQNQLLVVLEKCFIKDSWPEYESYNLHLDSLAKEILKQKKEWISLADIYSIFLDHVYKSLPDLNEPEVKHNAALKELLSSEEIKLLADQLFSYFEGVPRVYSVYCPLPPMYELNESIELNASVSIKRVVSRQAYPGRAYPRGLLSINQDVIDPPQYFLVFKVKGYCNHTLNSSAANQAMSSYKIALQQALAQGMLIEDKSVPNGLQVFAWMDSHNVRKHYLVATDHNLPDAPAIEVPLSMEMCHFMESHKFADHNSVIKRAIESDGLLKLINKYFNSAAKLHVTDNKDALRVKIAVEWTFDSYLSNSLTMSFIQTCIALEALYGDDNSSDNLTQTLADRCAYSLGGSIEERRIIKENFRELYKIRSKIVHGCVGSIAPEEERYLNWGNATLKFSIFKEISQLKLDQINLIEAIT